MAEETLRETISNAMDSVSGGGDAGVGPGDSAPAPPSDAPVSPAPAEPTPATQAPSEPPAGSPSDPGSTPVAPVDRGDGRDPAGRFAPKPPVDGQTPVSPKAPGPAPTPSEPAQPAWKPPSSWKPAVREHWAKLPPDVQAEVTRREQDMIRQMGEVRPVMDFARSFRDAMAPYAPDIQSVYGGDMLRFTAENAQARHIIYHGPAQQKADLLAELAVNGGVPMELLDSAIARRMQGNGPAFQPQPPPQPQRTTRDEVLEILRQEAQAGLNHQAMTEVERLQQDPKYEYLEQLRPYMASLMETAYNEKRDLTLDQAYHWAAAQHPEIGPIVQRRSEERRQKEAADRAAQARRAAVSLPSGGAPQGSPGRTDGANLRATVEAAWDAAAERAAGR